MLADARLRTSAAILSAGLTGGSGSKNFSVEEAVAGGFGEGVGFTFGTG